MAQIFAIQVRDKVVDLDHPLLKAAAKELYGKQLQAGIDPIPLCEQELSFELKGVPACVGNAFQRMMTQELPGCYLTAEIDSMTRSTDPFMKPEFVINYRLKNIPLAHGVDFAQLSGLEMMLDVENATETPRSVCAGEMVVSPGSKVRLDRPIFNPNIELAVLQAGKRLVIDKIVPAEGLGRIVTHATVTICGRSIPQDLERKPREATHEGLQGDAQRSEFVQSSAVANPRHFKVTVLAKAAPKGSNTLRSLPGTACRHLIMHLRNTLEVIERSTSEPGPSGMAGLAAPSTDVSNWSMSSTDGMAVGKLALRGETDTVAELIRVEVNSIAPDIAHIGVDKGPDPTIIGVTVQRRGDEQELQHIVQKSISNLIALFTELMRQAAAA